jgi:acyl-CoA reductase-like NAD-dependent aldehyde dehydrogenase
VNARNYIDGAWAESGTVGESHNPGTGELLGTFADGGPDEARAAIDAARRTFERGPWSRDRALRATALTELADRMAERRDELVSLLSRENGKIIGDAGFEVDASIAKLRYFAGAALTDLGRAGEVAPGQFSMSLRQPAGVAAVLAPWNSPVALSVRSFAPALAAGCTVVLKLPGQTALTNGLLYEIIAATRTLPAGVVNAFSESKGIGGRVLVADPGVDVVSFTGSTVVGRAIMADAAPTLKKLSLELGGKTPMIVFADADLDAAVPVLVRAVTTFNGEFCMTGSRVLVQRARAGELRERLTAALADVRVGLADAPGTMMGPVIDAAAADRIDQMVETAAASGTVLLRGGRITSGPLARGSFLRPSLLEVDDVSADIVQKEVFGPVATFEVFDDEDDAVRKANATEYGLAASVWTRDVDRPLRVAREIDAGTIWTNTWAVMADQMEEGGFKQSGIGRLNGGLGLEEFQEAKHLVHLAHRSS